eukprot:1672955-Pleurochrysis_carterae.AAC.4
MEPISNILLSCMSGFYADECRLAHPPTAPPHRAPSRASRLLTASLGQGPHVRSMHAADGHARGGKHSGRTGSSLARPPSRKAPKSSPMPGRSSYLRSELLRYEMRGGVEQSRHTQATSWLYVCPHVGHNITARANRGDIGRLCWSELPRTALGVVKKESLQERCADRFAQQNEALASCANTSWCIGVTMDNGLRCASHPLNQASHPPPESLLVSTLKRGVATGLAFALRRFDLSRASKKNHGPAVGRPYTSNYRYELRGGVQGISHPTSMSWVYTCAHVHGNHSERLAVALEGQCWKMVQRTGLGVFANRSSTEDRCIDRFQTLQEAQTACVSASECVGVTKDDGITCASSDPIVQNEPLPAWRTCKVRKRRRMRTRALPHATACTHKRAWTGTHPCVERAWMHT